MRTWTRKHSAAAAVVAIVAAGGLLAATQQGAFADAPESSRNNHPIEVKILAPDRGDNAGIAGRGWFVDLELDFPGGPDGLRQAGFGLQLTGPLAHANVAPFPGAFGPGHDDRLPGLVVLASTTNPSLLGFSGPGTNLAGLFNLTGVTDRSKDPTELWDTWIVGAPIAGSNVDTTLTVAVVADLNHNRVFDDAPDVIADLNHDGVVNAADLKALGVASNIESVDFHINADTA